MIHHDAQTSHNAKARLNSAIREAKMVEYMAQRLDKDFDAGAMHSLRSHAENLLRYVHEYNAINSAINA